MDNNLVTDVAKATMHSSSSYSRTHEDGEAIDYGLTVFIKCPKCGKQGQFMSYDKTIKHKDKFKNKKFGWGFRTTYCQLGDKK